MKRSILAPAILAALVGCGPVVSGRPPDRTAAAGSQKTLFGKDLYASLCATCHGAEGRGDGLAAEYLFPRPRDFTSGVYKFRSTATGEAPTDDDILRTITRGIPGSAMPPFAHLSPDQSRSLVEFVKSLAVVELEGKRVNLFELRGPGRVIPLPPSPEETPELLARGRHVYEAQSCASCHGDTGRGDGPSAPTLVDFRNFPAPPANFARGIFKGGDTVADIYRRFTTGLNGTPMPSFEKSLSDEERWALAYYVRSLVTDREKLAAPQSGAEIHAAKVARVPIDPQAAEWDQARPVDVALMMTWQRIEAPNVVSVRALWSETHVGILLEWEDATADGAAISMTEYSDSAAVMLAMTDPSGHFTMGEKGRPCNIWHWRFSRQIDMAQFRDVEAAYPGMASDDYYLAANQYPKKTDQFPGHRPVASAPSHDRTHLTAAAAGNTLADPAPRTCVEDLNAVGFGTLAPQGVSEQDVTGRGLWKAGTWRVSFVRPIRSAGPDAKVVPGKRMEIAFAVWDGRQGDRDGKKLVTYWQWLLLE
ncbi:MAG: c-type cytochrome [Planctomycetes bacterium]|nr:c-type cytochrome [Planctomycetota bacterium]